MNAYMYILRCADDSYYVGSTTNLKARLYQHQMGEGSNHTKKHLPVTLVYCEEFERIDAAFAREKQVQKWRRQKKEALINHEFEKLPELSASRASTSSATGYACSATGYACSATGYACSATGYACLATGSACSTPESTQV